VSYLRLTKSETGTEFFQPFLCKTPTRGIKRKSFTENNSTASFMKITLFLSFWLAFATFFSPVDKAFLTGKITGDKGVPLIGATVKILKNRELINSAVTNAEGKYRIEVEPGVYDVEVAYTGYIARRITEVQISATKENTLDLALESGASLEEVTVSGYKTPRIEAEKATGSTLTSDDIRSMPTRDTKAVEGAATGRAKKKSAEKMSVAEPPAPKSASPEMEFDKKADYKPSEADIVEINTEEIADDKVVTPPPGGPTQPTPRAGLLTAGEWNDLHNWNNHWTDLLADGEIESYQTMYGFFPKTRYTVLLINEQDFPVSDAVVRLKSNGEVIWEAKTDNTGKAELWAGLFDKKEFSNLKMEAWVNGKKHELDQPKPAKDGINFLKINAECSSSKNVDIVWAVDATGSMGDEIEYLKTELLDVIGRAKSHNPGLAFRMGTVFYRDQSDAYITKSSGLSPDIPKTVEFIKKQYADGGGDYPEAVHSALEEAIFSQKWSENAIARICFLVLDASPHQLPEVKASLQKSIREAARLGIRIVPVTASGIQKDTEFLMKFFGLATNGTYVFLTDHSGIGGKHLEPTSDEYKVEPLNELLVRLITEYTTIETCEGKSEIRFAGDPQDQNGNGQNANWQAFYYPNPASTKFTLELPFDVQSVTIYDAEGKAVRKLEKPQGGRHSVIVSDLAIGFYTIRILKEGRMQSGKLMVVRA
jgi:hypothetical protein